MDCVRTAVRQNAKIGKIAYIDEIEKICLALHEKFIMLKKRESSLYGYQIQKIIGTSQISSVLVEKIKLGEVDSSGRKKPEPIPNSEFEIKADMVIKALGFDPENLPKLFNSPDLFISKLGTIKINLKTMETNLSGVFAAGDIVRGASLVVWAIRDGREATISIQKYLRHKLNESMKAA